MLDILEKKLNQNINSNLLDDKEIQNINKRIDELNNEKDKKRYQDVKKNEYI